MYLCVTHKSKFSSMHVKEYDEFNHLILTSFITRNWYLCYQNRLKIFPEKKEDSWEPVDERLEVYQKSRHDVATFNALLHFLNWVLRFLPEKIIFYLFFLLQFNGIICIKMCLYVSTTYISIFLTHHFRNNPTGYYQVQLVVLRGFLQSFIIYTFPFATFVLSVLYT